MINLKNRATKRNINVTKSKKLIADNDKDVLDQKGLISKIQSLEKRENLLRDINDLLEQKNKLLEEKNEFVEWIEWYNRCLQEQVYWLGVERAELKKKLKEKEKGIRDMNEYYSFRNE